MLSGGGLRRKRDRAVDEGKDHLASFILTRGTGLCHYIIFRVYGYMARLRRIQRSLSVEIWTWADFVDCRTGFRTAVFHPEAAAEKKKNTGRLLPSYLESICWAIVSVK